MQQSISTASKFSIAEYKDFLFKKIVPLEELNDRRGSPLHKIMAYWRRNDLLPFIADAKWITISFAQLIWLRILDDLREVGFVSAKMKMVCDYFFKDAYYNDLPKIILEENKAAIKKKMLAGTQSEEDEILFLQIEQILRTEQALVILKFDINYLSVLVNDSISSGKEALIYIFFDGKVREYLEGDYRSHHNNPIDLMEPHITLSITHYLKEFIVDKDLSELFMSQVLNEDEQKVLKAMRRKNIRQITIYQNGNKKPRIETTMTGALSKELTQELKQRLGLKNYDKIILDTVDENNIAVTRIRKRI